MIEPLGNFAYDLAARRLKDARREAERGRLAAEVESKRPGRFERLRVLAGGRIESLGERLGKHGQLSWQSDENPMSGAR